MIFTKGWQGFDISAWQATCDFVKMRQWGAHFVVLRAGHGIFADNKFAAWWSEAKNAGLPRATYWYYEPVYPPIEQAEKAIAMLKVDKPEGRLWLDLEYSLKGPYVGPENWLKFLRHVEAAGFRAGIYTGFAWWNAQSGDKSAFVKYPLWLAWYTNDVAMVRVPAPWTKAMLWQDGTPAVGHEAGVGSVEIDHDWWNDDFDFAQEWGQKPPAPPEGGNTMKYGKVRAAALNIRSGVGATYPIIGALLQGDEVVSDSQAAGWWHLIDAKRNGQDITTNDGRPVRMRIDCWVSGTYLEEHASPPAPPPTRTRTHIIEIFSDGTISVDGEPPR